LGELTRSLLSWIWK